MRGEKLMKKLMAIVLTGVLAVSVLAACGNTDKDNAEPTKAPVSNSVKSEEDKATAKPDTDKKTDSDNGQQFGGRKYFR